MKTLDAKTPRIDAWYARLDEAARWKAYDQACRVPWYELAAWVQQEHKLERAPGRQAVYDFKKFMRAGQSAHRIEESIVARREVGTMAQAAGIDNQDLISAYTTMGADLAMRTGDADGAAKFTAMAMDLAAAQTKLLELKLRERAVAAQEKIAAERVRGDREKAVAALLEEAAGNAPATALLNQFLASLEGKPA